MSRIEETLSTVEARWLSILNRHCRSLFTGVFLPSHDHLHHARVWSHARSILILLDKSGTVIPEKLVEQLLIAVFFHDTGLIRTPDEQHGQESGELCRDFFRGNVTNEILHAIQYHDDKSLKSETQAFLPGLQPDLLSLLSASDDLDAFGRIGIYRYAEIYILRGFDPAQLKIKVSENIGNRFRNLKNNFKGFQEFTGIHEPRFRLVSDFYKEEGPSWKPVLMKIFRDNIISRRNLLLPERILPETEFEAEIREFFQQLDREVMA